MTNTFDKNNDKIDYWQQQKNWHELFNAVCQDQGYSGNSELAYLFCQNQGKTTLNNTEAAARNLSNWRSGANVPNRENLRILNDILNVSSNHMLREKWLQLYGEANKRNVYQNVEISNTNIENRNVFVFLTEQGWKSTALLLLVFAIVIIAAFWFITQSNSKLTEIEKMELNNIPWTRYVTLHVGEEVVVHGKRGLCNKLPKLPEKIEQALPKNLITGILKTGILGMRTSRRCNGPTPAREIIFKGLNSGNEMFYLYGDDINVTVFD